MSLLGNTILIQCRRSLRKKNRLIENKQLCVSRRGHCYSISYIYLYLYCCFASVIDFSTRRLVPLVCMGTALSPDRLVRACKTRLVSSRLVPVSSGLSPSLGDGRTREKNTMRYLFAAAAVALISLGPARDVEAFNRPGP